MGRTPGVIFVNSPYLYSLLPSGELSCSAAHQSPRQPPCIITNDHRNASSAAVVIWNPRWMSPQGNPTPLSLKPAGQLWVFDFYFESPWYQGHPVAYALTQQLSPGIDLRMTYRASSDVFMPTCRFAQTGIRPAEERDSVPHTRPLLLLAFISNCRPKGRLMLLERLKNALPRNHRDRVQLYGACGKKDPCGRNDNCIDALLRSSRFYFAAENACCEGYITEKFSRGLLVRACRDLK